MDLKKLALSAALLAASAGASASLNLSNYVLSGTYALSGAASEASAVTYNKDTGTLFVLGDEGDALVEVSKTGVQLSTMTLNNFNDTEGLTYIGGGQFVITEERLRDAYKFTYSAGGIINRTALAAADLGTTIGNIGIEGISYDPRNGTFITVKEKDPQEVNLNTITFGTPGGAQGTAVISALFAPALGLTDLSDVQVLAAVSSLIGTADADNLLIISQESGRIVETTRSGIVLSSFNIGGLSGNAEGITVDAEGNIYVVAEQSLTSSSPTLYVLKPVPVPAALPMMASALGGLMMLRRRKRSA